MDRTQLNQMNRLLETLGLTEVPMGLFYSDTKPTEGFSPKPSELPTREKEMRDEINWQDIFGRFSCAIGHIWRARKKGCAAYFSAQQFGCPGAAFWLGFNKPQAETIIHYVSTGIPNWTDGERYCDSPDNLRRIFEYVDPRPAPRAYCVVKPLDQLTPEETPELVIFFCRPETLSGLHQLAAFVTNDPEVVMSPWSAGCGSLAVWSLHYLAKDRQKAVVGGWDPSARKFYKTDELSFTVPQGMFTQMLARQDESFLSTKTWQGVRKKIARSKKAWGETQAE